MNALPISLQSALLLVASNVFMTFAWYGHLKNMAGRPWFFAALVSWGIALFEYLLQVPANRLGSTAMTLPQLKVLQEVITLLVFAPFAVIYMKQPMKLDYLWSGLCLVGAVYFVFRIRSTEWQYVQLSIWRCAIDFCSSVPWTLSSHSADVS